MTDYEYDPNLPYVVTHIGAVIGKFSDEHWAIGLVEKRPYKSDYKIIDTTPKPRVPDDAEFITWYSRQHREHYVALRDSPDSWTIAEVYEGPFEDLPGVTADTVFTVLDERKSDE